MGEEITVNIYLDPEFPIVKSLPSGSTLADLKVSLARDDPTGQTRAEDFDLQLPIEGAPPFDPSSIITQDMLHLVLCGPFATWQESHPAELAASAEGQQWDGQPASDGALVVSGGEEVVEAVGEEDAVVLECREYRVVQGPLVKKPGTQGPTGSKIIKVNKKVGASIMTTGKTWQGPAGGEWVELDAQVEKPGWLLVEGPGFDLPGPLLERVVPGEAPSVVITLYSAIQKAPLCDVLVRQSCTIEMVKSWIILRRREDVPMHKVWCTKATPQDVEGKYFLKTLSIIPSGTVLESLEFQDFETMAFVVIGADGEMC